MHILFQIRVSFAVFVQSNQFSLQYLVVNPMLSQHCPQLGLVEGRKLLPLSGMLAFLQALLL